MKLLVPFLLPPMLLTATSDPFVGSWKLNPE
jgi:hypothetical protein